MIQKWIPIPDESAFWTYGPIFLAAVAAIPIARMLLDGFRETPTPRQKEIAEICEVLLENVPRSNARSFRVQNCETPDLAINAAYGKTDDGYVPYSSTAKRLESGEFEVIVTYITSAEYDKLKEAGYGRR